MYKDMAIRTANGINSFCDHVISATGFTKEEALKVYHVFKAKKVLKIDSVNGTCMSSTVLFSIPLFTRMPWRWPK